MVNGKTWIILKLELSKYKGDKTISENRIYLREKKRQNEMQK